MPVFFLRSMAVMCPSFIDGGEIASTLGRHVLRQRLPRARGPQAVENPVQHLAQVHRAFAAALSRWRNHGGIMGATSAHPASVKSLGYRKAPAVRSKTVFKFPQWALHRESPSSRTARPKCLAISTMTTERMPRSRTAGFIQAAGFEVFPKRRIIERIFAWISLNASITVIPFKRLRDCRLGRES